jgi:hypothetical protein
VDGALSWPETEAKARALLRDWRGLLGRHASEARAVLRQLLEGRRVRFTPVQNGKQRGYRFEGDAGLGGLLDGLPTTCHVGWRPHRDSERIDTDLLMPFVGEVMLASRWRRAA